MLYLWHMLDHFLELFSQCAQKNLKLLYCSMQARTFNVEITLYVVACIPLIIKYMHCIDIYAESTWEKSMLALLLKIVKQITYIQEPLLSDIAGF